MEITTIAIIGITSSEAIITHSQISTNYALDVEVHTMD